MTAEPFHRLVQIMPSGCWEWTGTRSKEGYGKLKVRGRPRATFRAHRVAYECANGPIPAGVMVCHKCDNPPCCNPAHLWLGTPTDNVRDAASKGRLREQAKTHCIHGHELAADNIYQRGDTRRRCKACAREKAAAQYQRKLQSIHRGAVRANNVPGSNNE